MMRILRGVLTTAAWRKSHRAMLFLGSSLVVVSTIIGSYYVEATQHPSGPTSENTKSTQPSASVPSRSDTSINGIDIESVTQSENIPAVKTSVQVNGQQIQTPSTGTVHKVIHDNNGTTTVDVSVDAHSSGTTSTNSSTNVELNSTTELNSSSRSSQ